jgi:hypothetical protein
MVISADSTGCAPTTPTIKSVAHTFLKNGPVITICFS